MQRRTLALAAVLLSGAALVLFCCGGERETGRGAASPIAPSAGAEPEGAAPSATTSTPEKTPETAPQASAAASASASSGSSEPPSPGTRIVDAVRTSQPEDLALLSQIERELSQDPPPEIHALLAQRRNGAGRAELERSIAALADLRLKVLARRWLDRVLPKAAPAH